MEVSVSMVNVIAEKASLEIFVNTQTLWNTQRLGISLPLQVLLVLQLLLDSLLTKLDNSRSKSLPMSLINLSQM
jgi:hypothetical protein